MKKVFAKTRTIIMVLGVSAGMVACAAPGAHQGGPGEYSVNYESVPLSNLYPGSYPQSPTSNGR